MLQTEIEVGPLPVGLSAGDRIMVLGSCFADGIGRRLREAGFEVCVNPFGTLYNPVSLGNAVARLSSGVPFSEEDCVEMGAGAGLVCSFSHHTSFARPTAEEFLEAANGALAAAAAFWKDCNKVILTVGTAWCYRSEATGETVANCLKRPAAEFSRYRLGTGEAASLLGRVADRHSGKQFILTVSPVRHLGEGAHANQLSKSTLLLAVDQVCAARPSRCAYFPAYEILLDQLRDYRFYAEDMVHPSAQAEDYVFDRFLEAVLPQAERAAVEARRKAFRRSRHDPTRRIRRSLELP